MTFQTRGRAAVEEKHSGGIWWVRAEGGAEGREMEEQAAVCYQAARPRPAPLKFPPAELPGHSERRGEPGKASGSHETFILSVRT